MSNALPILLGVAAATRPTTQPIAASSAMVTTLCGIGICVLGIWLAHGVVKPSKFKLSGSPGRSNRLTPLHIAAVFLGAMLTAGLSVSVIAFFVELDDIQKAIIGGTLFPIIGLTGGLIVAKFSFDNGAVRGMGFTRRRWVNDSIRSIIGYLAIFPVCMILLHFTTEFIVSVRPELIVPHPYLKILMEPEASTFWRTMIIVTACVLAPLGEEVLFRGLLQSMLRRYLRSPWWAIVVTSLLFALIHIGADIKSLPALFALSLVLGYSYERTGRLYSPIMIHMIFNAVMVAETLNH
jgi:membrane protease YdiL (CAAX protease family)